ncbi:MAG: hypothetical protein BAJATHORv1_90061 [Candidatus Thorarchaeota archaeon]|nr:MAG: hypothetical protein BAJATHORv1_90061 [Candidatus Thorarchaeota archaeon]
MLNSGLEEIEVVGLVSKIRNQYVITTDEGIQYELAAIKPQEAVARDYDLGSFAHSLGKRMLVIGMTDGETIWGAKLEEQAS